MSTENAGPFSGPHGGAQFATDYLNAALVRNDHQLAAALVDELPATHVRQAVWMLSEYVFAALRQSPTNIVPEFAPIQGSATPAINVIVQPADVTVLPTEPKTRTIERDSKGEIVAVHEEP